MTPHCLPRRRAARALTFLPLLLGVACSRGGSSVGNVRGDTVHPELQSIAYGRLVDVFGYTSDGDGQTKVLYRRDVVIGGDIEDQRPSGTDIRDDAILFDFDGTDPLTLQPRLLIPREVGSPEFLAAFEQLDAELRDVTAMRFGTAKQGQPFTVVPRNAGIRLRFSAPLGIDDGFFVARDDKGRVTQLRNAEAVQLLSIVGDPEQPYGLAPLPVRIVVREREIVLDPVLLGDEGLQYQTSNRAWGLPESPDSAGANIRIAIALEGPLAIPSLREPDSTGIVGNNNSLRKAVIRDFRSGNREDTSADIVRGFVRDPLPLRIVGKIPMYLERVDDINATTQVITVYKNGIEHEIDVGDVFQFFVPGQETDLADTDVVNDPPTDRGNPGVQHVQVRVRRVPGLSAIDPRNLPGYPVDLQEREQWLVENAPVAICNAEFTAGGVDGRDDPRLFLSFTPQPMAIDGYQPAANEFVSPHATATVRFTKPVDMSTVKWADTFFFAMRDVTSQESIDDFIANTPNNAGGIGMDPSAFNAAKFRMPYLIASRVYDEDGSQSLLKLQPTLGFYLDEAMRDPASTVDYRYYLHLMADSEEGGVRDLAGNPVDLQGTTPSRNRSIVIPFTVDTRKVNGEPVFEDNLVVSIIHRFADLDEDANPSYFHQDEVRAPGTQSTSDTASVRDVFGGVLHVDGRLAARQTSRTRIAVDDRNQAPMQAQTAPDVPPNPLAWHPQTVGGERQTGSNSTGSSAAGGIQNPNNPFGCRLQTVWREVDMSLSRDDPNDFNLDIEQMYWAPFGEDTDYDVLDLTTLVLGTSEFRPTPCTGQFSALPSLHESGLRGTFQTNYLHNPQPTGTGTAVETFAPRTTAYADAPLRIVASDAILDPTGNNTYLPLPKFRQPYFVFRDETVMEQGGDAGGGSDLTTATGPLTFAPYILSPFAMGQGRRFVEQGGTQIIARSYWNDATCRQLNSPTVRDNFTGGLLGAIALPLLADMRTMYDSTELPAEAPGFASGLNGWQTAVTVGSDPRPRFRVFSAGRPGAAPQGELAMGPSNPGWNFAVGGWGPVPGSPNAPWTVVPPAPPGFPSGPDIKGDNTLYWVMLDVLKRQSVATFGFLDVFDPHRVPEGHPDTRLGPYFLDGGVAQLPAETLPAFGYEFDPPLSQLPGGTSIVAQFRGAGVVDDEPWYWKRWIETPNLLWPTPTATNPSLEPATRQLLKPTAENFPLDPLKAGDAHIRKWDTRPQPGTSQPRNNWTYLYNRHVTGYVEDPNTLLDEGYLQQFSTGNDPFTARDVRYLNWRFIMRNNVEAVPPVDPSIDTFAVVYRFQRQSE